MIRTLLLATVAAGIIAQTSPAAPHLIDHPRHPGLKERARSQHHNVLHSRYVCRHGAGVNKRWHCKALVWLGREYRQTLHKIEAMEQAKRDRQVGNLGATAAIRRVFGSYWQQAIAVARCESGLSVWAQNGQYLGLFQMGSSERSLYGHGSTAYAQAIAAHRYFVASGRDWSPWQCKPW
jgi:hypothetical protein